MAARLRHEADIMNRQKAPPYVHTTLLLVGCRVLCVKVVGATSSEGFLFFYLDTCLVEFFGNK